MVTPVATPLATPRPAAWAAPPLPHATLPSLTAIGGPLVPGTMPPPVSSVSSVRQGLAAPTPNELIESERDRQGSISLLRRRAFEESARQQRDRESAIHQELHAAQAECGRFTFAACKAGGSRTRQALIEEECGQQAKMSMPLIECLHSVASFEGASSRKVMIEALVSMTRLLSWLALPGRDRAGPGETE